ncbi:ROK family transcriptional regulator [Alkalihalobacillus pseudalcaliphilus]|uniref:ROK family transcriptional regulator n=1 Tax=Alkalihalobacillus pseudalcaliphilus TaxID=79884 RepID=UPI00064D7FBB|nr:ROK family transcriptional regulator [Alkalihalobacillus pseudalcaliphilus]KMK78024.1 ROK family protein [Alkalihalobacillus pseudalcaliphilus]
MLQTFNQHVVKQRNKALILHTLIDHYPISRASLAAQTGLNKGTVSSLVSELIDEHLILESGPGISSGGRRPVMLLFNQAAGYSIGIDIGVNYILALLTDLQGKIVIEKKVEIDDTSLDNVLTHLFMVIDELFENTPKSPYSVIGIGIGVPATVNKDGEVLMAPNLHWRNINLKQMVNDKYDVPVTIHNEANAGAYGEKRFGAGKLYKDLIYVSGGIGIGVGLIFNNELYLGEQGLSGELGHMTIQMDGPICNCGNQGCWELYASERALLQTALKEGVISKDQLYGAFETIIDLAERGDERTLAVIHQLGKNLAVGLKNMINIFNPEQIIIGNRLAELKKWLHVDLERQLKSSKLTNPEAVTKLQFSELNKRSAALGVAAFSTEYFITMNLETL